MDLAQLIYHSFTKARGDRVLWNLDPSRLRILCYHGICEDRLAEESWLPAFFVTQSRFEMQLRYLRDNVTLLPLIEAGERLRAGTLPPRPVSITFDDGYANNLHLAAPLLRKYNVPATIFLSSAYMETGDFFPFLKVKFARMFGSVRQGAEPLLEYKTNPVDRVIARADQRFRRLELTDDQRNTLRPLTIGEVRSMAALEGIELGGHTHTHCILRNETPERRKQEIQTSIRRVAEWTGKPARLFSYPNGEQGDFGEIDKDALRSEGIHAAVTGIAGANNGRAELLAPRRYPMGLHHDEITFGAEVTGFRSVVLKMSRRFR